MSSPAPEAIGTSPPAAGDLRRRRRRLLAAAVVILVGAGVAIVVADPFGGSPGAGASSFDNGAPTGTTTVARRPLSSQTLVSATLGYADPGTIVQPGGTSPSALLQARQTESSAGATLAGAQATLAADEQALVGARSTLAADRRKQALDCRGAGAAEAPGSGGAGASSGSVGPCAADVQAVATDTQTVTSDEAKVAADRRSVASAAAALSAAQTSLAQASSSSTAYAQSSTYTRLPDVGAVISRGEPLYDVDGQPVVLLYGSATPWRTFAPGMSPGRDVAELNANLRALGYGSGLRGSAYGAATEAAVRAFQSAHGLPVTGSLPLGTVAFEPGAVRVTADTPSLGAAVQAGPVLSVTSTRREVQIALDASQQADVKVGDPVTITLPDNSTTPGKVTSVGTVATTPSDQGNPGGSSSPTIEVDVTPTDPKATGRLDQAPVNVSITTASVRDAYVVPVDALLALASGGYALEQIEPDGTHRLLAVELGLFDDADGLVQVTGSGIRAGMRIVVPGG